MKILVALFAILLAVAPFADAQNAGAPPVGSTPLAPPPAKRGGEPVQHGAQPNPGEVRPGNEAGDSPSATAGELTRAEKERRIFGLPVTAAIVIGGVLIVMFVIAAFVVPARLRRAEARGGTYGRPR